MPEANQLENVQQAVTYLNTLQDIWVGNQDPDVVVPKLVVSSKSQSLSPCAIRKKIKPPNCWGVSCLAKDPYTSSHISSKSSIGLALIEVQQDPTFSVCRNTMPALSNSMISGVRCSVEKKPKDVWQEGYPAKKRTYKSSLFSKGMLE